MNMWDIYFLADYLLSDNEGENSMSSNANDCSVIEQRVNEHNLYISTTQDQLNKLEADDPDIQNKRDALNRKLNNLHEQANILQRTLEECRQGKAVNFPSFESISESEAG